MPEEQGLLDITLPRRRALGRSDFLVSGSNETALSMIDADQTWPNRQLALTGPEGAGKTHLAHVWMESSGAERVVAARLLGGDVAPLASIGAVVVEDVDAGLEAGAEEALFHLLNLMRENGQPILLTSRAVPSACVLRLPDLASRVAGMTHVALSPPDDDLMRDLLIKQFEDRHLSVGPNVIAYLEKRIERSAKAAAEVAAALDQASRRAARGITIRLVKDELGL